MAASRRSPSWLQPSLEADPVVPKPTVQPASNHSRTGARPNPMRRSGAMRCTIPTPAAAYSAISASGASTMCASHAVSLCQPASPMISQGVLP